MIADIRFGFWIILIINIFIAYNRLNVLHKFNFELKYELEKLVKAILLARCIESKSDPIHEAA